MNKTYKQYAINYWKLTKFKIFNGVLQVLYIVVKISACFWGFITQINVTPHCKVWIPVLFFAQAFDFWYRMIYLIVQIPLSRENEIPNLKERLFSFLVAIFIASRRIRKPYFVTSLNFLSEKRRQYYCLESSIKFYSIQVVLSNKAD